MPKKQKLYCLNFCFHAALSFLLTVPTLFLINSPLLFLLWYFSFILTSSPSNTMLQMVGEIAEPRRRPRSVGNNLPVSTYPLFNHFRRISLSIGYGSISIRG